MINKDGLSIDPDPTHLAPNISYSCGRTCICPYMYVNQVSQNVRAVPQTARVFSRKRCCLQLFSVAAFGGPSRVRTLGLIHTGCATRRTTQREQMTCRCEWECSHWTHKGFMFEFACLCPVWIGPEDQRRDSLFPPSPDPRPTPSSADASPLSCCGWYGSVTGEAFDIC